MLRIEIEKLLKTNEFKIYPSQQKICLPILQRIILKMEVNLNFMPIKIYNNLIIDGHHRFIASEFIGQKIEMIKYSKPTYIKKENWGNLYIDESDWESHKEIILWNIRDADYNQISLSELMKKIK